MGVVAGPACGLERANVVGLKADPNRREDRLKRATGSYKVFNTGVVVKGGVIRCHVERGDVEMVRVCLYGRAGAMVQRKKASKRERWKGQPKLIPGVPIWQSRLKMGVE